MVMSSSIYNEHTAWNVSNMMFGRVLDFAGDVAKELAFTEREHQWVRDLSSKIEGFGTYSPDVNVSELFPSREQLDFWQAVLREVASRIFRREIGTHSDQTWQVSTIWAAFDLARVLDSSAQQIRSGGAG
jgi:hypothetical protein